MWYSDRFSFSKWIWYQSFKNDIWSNITRIEVTEDLYDFMGEIDIVEIKFSKLSLQKELLLKNFKNITINKQNIKVNEEKILF